MSSRRRDCAHSVRLDRPHARAWLALAALPADLITQPESISYAKGSVAGTRSEVTEKTVIHGAAAAVIQ